MVMGWTYCCKGTIRDHRGQFENNQKPGFHVFQNLNHMILLEVVVLDACLVPAYSVKSMFAVFLREKPGGHRCIGKENE